jgi:REP element-mobilizing transposase RayT
MARLARVIAVGAPHHVTQRGNRRQQVFFCDDDYALYKTLMVITVTVHLIHIVFSALSP